MKARRGAPVLLLTLFFAVLCAQAQTIPAVKAKALDDSEVLLPNPGGEQILILILGFSHKSGDICRDWGKQISVDYHGNARVTYFQIPELQSAPGFVRSMILHGMRKQVPTAEQPHFVPIFDNESAWKKLVNFSAPDDAYLIVTDTQGNVVWQTHGKFAHDLYTELKQAAARLLDSSAGTPISRLVPRSFLSSERRGCTTS
jgi:hypothetical protein